MLQSWVNETNGKFQAIFENHKQLERVFFYRFCKLEIYPGVLSLLSHEILGCERNWQFLAVSVD